MKKGRTLVFLPAYNVEDKVILILEALKRYKEDVLFFDDGSLDNTYKILEQYRFNCLSSAKNKGISNAIRNGLRYAKQEGYSRMIIMDSDGQHQPKYIPLFERKLRSANLVIGNRFSSIRNVPTSKISSNLFATMIVSMLFNKVVDDVTCGFKAFHITKGIENIIRDSNDYSIVFDLLFYGLKNNYVIKEVNITPVYHKNELLYCKRREAISFLMSIEKHKKELRNIEGFNEVANRIFARENFTLDIRDVMFYGFYINNYDGYIIQHSN